MNCKIKVGMWDVLSSGNVKKKKNGELNGVLRRQTVYFLHSWMGML